jgi:hypothetical protein
MGDEFINNLEGGAGDSGEMSQQDVDALISQSQQPFERPEIATDTPPQQDDGIKFTANGKEIVAKDIDQLKQWASQGYNYSQHMQDFNKKQADFEQNFEKFSNIDKFAQDNPDWWNHVQKQYEERESFNPLVNEGTDNQPKDNENVDPAFQELKSQLDELKQFKNDFMAERVAEQRTKEDQALSSEIQSIRENHSDLDWETPNTEGKNLEYQVLEHAKSNGINSFRAAFRDFYHDKLLESAQLKAKESLGNSLKKVNSLGILGETPTPIKNLQQQVDTRNMTYDEIEAQLLKEHGLA